MATYRAMVGYMDLHLSQSPKIELKINRPLTDEIFSSLHYLSEIEEIGYDFLRSHGLKKKREIKSTFALFQAFTRQGKTFFKSAETLEYRAQPLFYYYSFLNLAKAYLCIRDPSIFNKKMYHGLVHKHKSAIFTKQNLKTNNGVFSYLYEHLTGKPIKKGTTLNISSLFGYIPEIGYEHTLVEYGKRKYAGGISRIFANNVTNEYWPFLAVTKNEELYKNKKYFKNLFNFFEVVEIPKQDAKRALNLDAASTKEFVFLQGKKTYKANPSGDIDDIIPESIEAGKNCIIPLASKSDFNFHLFMPLKNNLQIDFNDILATYAIMYYLGSLVRYFPEYLEGLLNSKHAWIIENFTKNVSSSFLLNINNLIQKKNFIYF